MANEFRVKNGLIVDGNTNTVSLSGATISGSSIYSGSTNLSTLFTGLGSPSIIPTQVGYGNSSSGFTGSTGVTYNSQAETQITTSGFRISSLTGGTKFEIYQPNRTAGFNSAFSILTSEAGTNGGTTASTVSRIAISRIQALSDGTGVFISTGLDASHGIGTTSGDLVIQAATSILRGNSSGLQLGTTSRQIGNIYINNSTGMFQSAGSTGVYTLQLGATRDDGAANKTAYLIKGASAYTTTHYLSVTDNQNNTMFTIAPDGKTGIALSGSGTGVVVPTAFLDVRNSSANTASFRLRSGSTIPSSPNNGDIWNDGTHLYTRLLGRNIELDNDLQPQQVAFGSSYSGLSGSSYFKFLAGLSNNLSISSSYGNTTSFYSGSDGGVSSSSQLSLYGAIIAIASSSYMRIGGDYNGFKPEFRIDSNGLRFCVDGFDTIGAQNVNTGITLSHGNLMVGANVLALARVDILSSTTTTAQLRLRSGSTVSSPNLGDIYNHSGVIRFNSDLGVNYLSGATGTTRMVEVNSGGTLSASKEIIGAIVDDATAISLITTTTNWTVSGVYTGSTITNTYQGQMYNDDAYFYVAMADNYFIRMIRG